MRLYMLPFYFPGVKIVSFSFCKAGIFFVLRLLTKRSFFSVVGSKH